MKKYFAYCIFQKIMSKSWETFSLFSSHYFEIFFITSAEICFHNTGDEHVMLCLVLETNSKTYLTLINLLYTTWIYLFLGLLLVLNWWPCRRCSRWRITSGWGLSNHETMNFHVLSIYDWWRLFVLHSTSFLNSKLGKKNVKTYLDFCIFRSLFMGGQTGSLSGTK